MDIGDLEGVDSTFGLFYREMEESESWNNHRVRILSDKKNLSDIFYQNVSLSNEKKEIKSMMGTLRDGAAKAEAGYTETDGLYGKVSVEWKFGPEKEESKSESDRTSKGPGEVNSTDKDRD